MSRSIVTFYRRSAHESRDVTVFLAPLVRYFPFFLGTFPPENLFA